MANEAQPPVAALIETVGANLCLACGLCCDGTLFKDVELQVNDLPAREAMEALLASRGQETRLKSKWPQPCAALCSDLRCRIYADRPSRCREFECRLLKAVADSSRKPAEALKVIGQTRKVADQVRRLLRELGDAEDHLPLGRRFRRMRRRYEAGGLASLDEAGTERYSELTLAVHQLQLLLQREFYP